MTDSFPRQYARTRGFSLGLPRAFRIATASKSSRSPTPWSRTAPAAKRSPLRLVTSSVSPFLPVNFASLYTCWRPVSLTPGPNAGPWNTGRIRTPAFTSAGASVENENVVTRAASFVGPRAGAAV